MVYLYIEHAIYGNVNRRCHSWVSSTTGAGQPGFQGEQPGDGQVLLLHCDGHHPGEPMSPTKLGHHQPAIAGSLQVYV